VLLVDGMGTFVHRSELVLIEVAGPKLLKRVLLEAAHGGFIQGVVAEHVLVACELSGNRIPRVHEFVLKPIFVVIECVEHGPGLT